MKILINAATAKMGGAATYIKNLVRELPKLDKENEYIFCLPEEHKSSLGLFFWQQVSLRKIIKKEKIDLLFSTANFATLFCPCKQILLMRMPLYFAPIYLEKIVPRKSLKSKISLLLRRWFVCLSCKRADIVMTPTQAMMNDLRKFVKIPEEKTFVNHYGTYLEKFYPQPKKKHKISQLLYLTLYGEHKNFRTLFKALLLLKKQGINNFRLISPIDFDKPLNRETVTFRRDWHLASRPEIKNHLNFSRDIPYEEIDKLYRQADIFLWPSIAESFGHPLIEAMASGLPIIASDIPVNREICQEAALYFAPLNSKDLSDKIKMLMGSPVLQKKLKEAGIERVKEFKWQDHVKRLIKIFNQLHGY